MINTLVLKTEESNLEKAGQIIRSGGLVVFPTETVYGLGANALDDKAVKKIYEAKGRPSDNPLIVHISKKEDIYPLVENVSDKAKKLMDAFFPGPLTIIQKKSNLIGDVVSGGLDTVAVRMPSNKIANEFISACGVPIAAPSANISGLPSPTKTKYVMDDMMGRVDAIIDGGDCEYGVESTVLTLATEVPTILRPGSITKEMIEEVIGKVKVSSAVLEQLGENETAASPGMKYKHYAPKARIIMVDADKTTYEKFVNSKTDAYALCFDDDNITIPHVTYGNSNDEQSQARELFSALRSLDEMNAKKVYARMPKKDGVSMAVYNRLIRACAFTVIDLKKPFTIGLTGPTGSGKGFVCGYLRELGFNIIDTDALARDVVEKGSPVLNTIQKAFGNDVINPDGTLNRKALGQIVFNNQDKKELLNSIIHPAIIEKSIECSSYPCVLDAPQLFEAKAENLCYKIICVDAPLHTRLNRIMVRDSLTKEQAMSRINSQYSQEFYENNSDYVITNDSSDIKPQLERILEEIL